MNYFFIIMYKNRGKKVKFPKKYVYVPAYPRPWKSCLGYLCYNFALFYIKECLLVSCFSITMALYLYIIKMNIAFFFHLYTYSYRGIFHDFYCCFCFSSVLYTFILFITYKFSDLSLHFDNEMKKKLSRT